jgi:1-phosphofructokinase family hexose kinase
MRILTVTLHPSVDRVLAIERLCPDDAARATVEMAYCGGKGNNVARALKRLGYDATAMGFQGGSTGAFAADQLGSEGVQTAFTPCQAATRISTIVHEQRTGDTFAIYEPGQHVTTDEVQALERQFEALIAEHDICVLSGSGQPERLSPLFGWMVTTAHEAHVRCLLDSSGEALARAIPSLPYLVKVNLSELTDCLCRPLDTEAAQIDALRELCARGVSLAAVSRGPDGLLLTDGQAVWQATYRAERVVNVIGCGDSLLAGMIKATCDSAALQDVARWGVACGAANTQAMGAGNIALETVTRILDDVSVTQVR